MLFACWIWLQGMEVDDVSAVLAARAGVAARKNIQVAAAESALRTMREVNEETIKNWRNEVEVML